MPASTAFEPQGGSGLCRQPRLPAAGASAGAFIHAPTHAPTHAPSNAPAHAGTPTCTRTSIHASPGPCATIGGRHGQARARMRAVLAAAATGLLLATAAAQAHKSSDAYLFFDQQADRTSLRWDIALRDLDAALGLDADGDRALTWGEVRTAWPRIEALALQSLAVPGCSFLVDGHALEQRNDGVYAVLQLGASCRVTAQATLRYSLFADIDSTHRGIVRHTVAGGAATVRMLVPQVAQVTPVAPSVALTTDLPAAMPAAIPDAMLAAMPAAIPAAIPASMPAATPDAAPLAADATPATLAPAVPAAATAADPHPPSFIREGVHHIVTGYDHLLFLLCLLLPAVLWRSPGPPVRWQAVVGWRQALGPVAKTVTLFTLAHSVTLALAATGWVRLAPSFVEPAIAATIMLAAFDNLRPLLLRWRGAVTFGFGLIHGFGFAGVLGELQLPAAQFGWALFQFNLGLELGQLALVLSVVPLLFLLRRRAAYVPWVLRAGSVAALLMAALWLVERTADWTGVGA